MDLFGGLLGIGANLFGQSQTNAMQAQMMQQQQAFQEQMSNTAYQRATADMQKAGLNPMMMFSSGSAASTPGGASPSPMVKSGLDADAMQKSISTAVQAKVANATIDNLVAQNAKIKAETLTEGRRPELISAQTGETDQSARLKLEHTRTEPVKRELLRQEIPIVRNRAIEAANQERINPTARKIFDQGSYLGRKGSDTLAPVTDIVNSAAKVRRLFEDRWP